MSHSPPSSSRRAFLGGALGALGAAAASGWTAPALALGRTPIGGKWLFRVPWSLASIDPHDLRDPIAALFGAAAFDSLFGFDASGNVHPVLATQLPMREAGATIVRLREGVRTARQTALDARDVVASIERARARGGAALWIDLPKPAVHPTDKLAVSFGSADTTRVSRALASPLFAIVPRSFSASAPDGTGPFRADFKSGALSLTRNAHAARGAAFLDAIDVESAPDLRASLRQFEAERDDIGWLGMGLFNGRKNATKIDLGAVAHVVLAIGSDAGALAGAGIAQKIVNALPSDRLGHLGLGTLPQAVGDPAWTGPKTELLVEEGATHLIEIARAIAPILSNTGHEVTVATASRSDLAKKRGKAALRLEVVRPLGPGSLSTLLALASADDSSRAEVIAKKPPKSLAASARALTSSLRVGVVGEIRITGGAASDIVVAKSACCDGWDLGASSRKPKKSP